MLDPEPPAAGNPLLAREDVVTPHVGAYVAEAYDRMAVAAAENPAEVVNPEVFA